MPSGNLTDVTLVSEDHDGHDDHDDLTWLDEDKDEAELDGIVLEL